MNEIVHWTIQYTWDTGEVRYFDYEDIAPSIVNIIEERLDRIEQERIEDQEEEEE